jgi:hypothetical protein
VAHEKKGTPAKPGWLEETTTAKNKDGTPKYPDEAVVHNGQKYSSDHDIYAIQKPDGTIMNSAEAKVEIERIESYGVDRIKHGAHVNAPQDVTKEKLMEIGDPKDVFSISSDGKILKTSREDVISMQRETINKYSPGAVTSWLP